MSELLDFIKFFSESDKLDYFMQGTCFGFLGFLLYLELNPKLTNIWFRIGSDGKRHFNLNSIVHFMSYPFKGTLFWQPENWDLNFLVMSGAFGLFYTLLRIGIDFATSENLIA